jgi:hypothetical protein
MSALDRGTFVRRSLHASDAWLDEEGQPKQETFATRDGELYKREARPSSAEVKALELAGRATGLVGEEGRGGGVQVNFVIRVPPKPQSSDEWLRQFQAGSYGGRSIPASPGAELDEKGDIEVVPP